MADVNYITDKNGNKVNIADLTARTNASTALLESEYNRQLADNVYAGRDISTITALASEIASAGSIPAFLNARAKAGNFNGLRIGDWTDIVLSSGVTMRYQIAAFEHYYNCAVRPWDTTSSGSDLHPGSHRRLRHQRKLHLLEHHQHQQRNSRREQPVSCEQPPRLGNRRVPPAHAHGLAERNAQPSQPC